MDPLKNKLLNTLFIDVQKRIFTHLMPMYERYLTDTMVSDSALFTDQNTTEAAGLTVEQVAS
tara:strand:+ start:11958 stop:12143 length:186 start_codon:yes stop_codon:yes gene_type:complete